jgi:hydroxyacylglutathione hydrolase
MISIKTIVFNPFAENTYVLYDETRECAIIDPGCYTDEENNHLKEVINELDLIPVSLLNTHCHIDHVLGNAFVNQEFGLDLQIPIDDKETYQAVPNYAAMYGFPNYKHLETNSYIREDDILKFGNSVLKAVFVPGHTQGHLAFVNEKEEICIGGDVLFDGSIGRTDLPGGDFNTLIDSIQGKLFKLPAQTVVYPGHGTTTTIEKEMNSNPFCGVNK